MNQFVNERGRQLTTLANWLNKTEKNGFKI